MSLAPAVSKDGFSYAGDMFVESSGHNRHRRATVAELKDHFKSGSDKDHPAHWFEAQCIHYGLQPSKTKAVARMRLFDAVNTGKLSVPSNIKKLETELKKEWTKSEREAKKAVKDASSSASATKSTKRKAAADSVDFTVSVGDINISVSANSAAKKSKTTATKAASTATASKTTKQKTASSSSTTKAKPKPTASPKKSSSAAPSSSAPTPSTPTARGRTSRGRGGHSHQGPGRSGAVALAPSPSPPRRIQTARRSRGWHPGLSHTYGSRTGYNNGPDNDDKNDVSVKAEDGDDGDDELKPIGLLNGRYDINITDGMAIDDWDLSLVLTLNGSQLWGSFDLGCVRGVLKLPQRPYQPSYDPLDFIWRGREDGVGKISYGNNHRGRMKFLGDGRIEGEIDEYGIVFTGRRTSGQNTRSEIDVATMKDEWDTYTYELFDEENSYKWRGY
ncbi:hypothetical protein F5B19DRAFT_133728 [Rostrohypoxylon terebratum]|nr:hypothetical protein F5B19DRAFT_133728 [Rostrohypoxylon terebratum]